MEANGFKFIKTNLGFWGVLEIDAGKNSKVNTTSCELRAMIKIDFLGTGNAFLPHGRLHSLVLIDSHILVDTPLTVLASLREANISPHNIDTIFFTHMHADHTFGFPSFLIERKYISDRTAKNVLNIHHSKNAKLHLQKICDLAYPKSLNDRLESNTIWNEKSEGKIKANQNWEFERFEVCHDPDSEPHGYLFKNKSENFTIMHTGDSGPCEEIESRIPLCDVVIIEMGVPSHVNSPHHYNPNTLEKLSREYPGVTFLVTHHFADSPDSKNGPLVSNILPQMPSNVIQPSDYDSFIWENGKLRIA
mgnify:CR=1 FL=1